MAGWAKPTLQSMMRRCRGNMKNVERQSSPRVNDSTSEEADQAADAPSPRLAVLRHTLGQRVAPFIIVMLLVGAGILVGVTQRGEYFGGPWGVIDAVITLATLLTAVTVWWGETEQDWRAQLPRRISVTLVYQDKPLCVCALAPLVGDVRAYAVQIAGRMLMSQLEIYPVPDVSPTCVEHWRGEWFVHHRLSLYLMALPKHCPPIPKTGLLKRWDADNRWGRTEQRSDNREDSKSSA
jgi:hypothetical protein